ISKLQTVVRSRNSCIVQGESGSGKTTIVTAFLNSINVRHRKEEAPAVVDVDSLFEEFLRSDDQILVLDEFLKVEPAFRSALSKLPEGTLVIRHKPHRLDDRMIIGIGSEPEIATDVKSRFMDRVITLPGICRGPNELIFDFLNMCQMLMNE